MTEQKKEKPLDLSAEKQPIDMTSDELLDYALAPEIAAELRKIAQGEKPAQTDSDERDC